MARRVVTKVINRRFNGAAYDVYVARPSDFGNPYGVRSAFASARPSLAEIIVPNLADALRGYEQHLLAHPDLIERARRELHGKTLGCWCVMDLMGKAPIVCHAQILARVADGRDPPILPAPRARKGS